MLTLGIDTAHSHLTCCLIKDDEVLHSISYPCFKKQSEEIFVALTRLFAEANVQRKDIDSICVAEGPGSYTGVRIGMTIAKVIGEVLPCDVYTISTLRLYAAGQENTMVILNARADRAYIGVFDKNQIIMEDCVLPLADIDIKDYSIIGDGTLVGKPDNYPDIAKAFLNTKPIWNKIENIAYLVPKYLKESESYYR